MSDTWVPFTKPYRAPHEMVYLNEVLGSGLSGGDGPFTRRATEMIESLVGAPHALLTGSGTHALELAAWLLDLEPGDEVIVPSFTFSTTAAAVVATGATPVFVDIEPTTLGLDMDAVEAAVTPRTRAVFVVHYGGVAPDMDRLAAIALRHGLAVVEDNAHGLGARWRGRETGTFGIMAAQSFHATKNIQCGEGGALLLADPTLFARAEIIREKGTDRSKFIRGQVDKYTWVDRGSSYLPSELQAAVLTAQLEEFETIQAARHAIWDTYSRELAAWATRTGATLMAPPPYAEHPAHVFYLLTPDAASRTELLDRLRVAGIGATFHYIPLDSSEAGRRFGRTPSPCTTTADVASRLVRLPLWAGMTDEAVSRVLEAVEAFAIVPSRI